MSVFDESKHPRDNFGRFTEKGNGRKSKRKQALDILRKRLVKIDLQFFTEKEILKQTSKEIISGIETLKKRIKEHEYKIAHPWEFYKDWFQVPEIVQKGRLLTWQKEIANHTNGIKARIEELKKRGIDYDTE